MSGSSCLAIKSLSDLTAAKLGNISTHLPDEILLRLLTATEDIRELLRQKTDREYTPESHETLPQRKDPPEEAEIAAQYSPDTNLTGGLNTNAITDDWPNEEKIIQYRERLAKHKRECEKMHVELGYFIAHLGIVRGDQRIIKEAELIREKLLPPVQSVERVLDERQSIRTQINIAINSFFTLWDEVDDLCIVLDQQDALPYITNITQWRDCLLKGYRKINALLIENNIGECLSFIHEIFFVNLETAMSGFADDLMIFENKSANKWLVCLKIEDFEKQCKEYINCVFPTTDSNRAAIVWPETHVIALYEKRFREHRKVCKTMREELDHFVAHYVVVGGDSVVIEATGSLKDEILAPVSYLEKYIDCQPENFQIEMSDAIQRLFFAVVRFQRSLYNQKHAFYFRKVKQWVCCLWTGMHKILSLLRLGKVSQCITYIHDTFLSEVERAMIGVTYAEQLILGGKPVPESVPEELRTFGKESLPKFLVDQMERDTTRYVNITTIATFFSSVTATTLQFTYAPLQAEASDSLRGVVNLFWFLSLVFSVSSGVSSLLGLTWRKSSIYNSRVPPKLIGIWFDMAPMLYLVIAAVAFVIGLNLFAYLSLQPLFVSLATNILTGLHGICLLGVTFWFIYQLKPESVWAGWIRKVMRPITLTTERMASVCLICMIWISLCMKRIGFIMKRPYDRYKENLHLQRNLHWAFGNDNRVVFLNYYMRDNDFPEPYMLSKMIRRIVHPLKRCWLGTGNALSAFGKMFMQHTCRPLNTGHEEDGIELAESGLGRQERTYPSGTKLTPKSPADEAKRRYHNLLRERLGETDLVQDLMICISVWEEGATDYWLEGHLKRELWGYPGLLKEFYENLKPVLTEAREQREREMSRWVGVCVREDIEDEGMDDRSPDWDNGSPCSQSGGAENKTRIEPSSLLIDQDHPSGLETSPEPPYTTQSGTKPKDKVHENISPSEEIYPLAGKTGGARLLDFVVERAGVSGMEARVISNNDIEEIPNQRGKNLST